MHEIDMEVHSAEDKHDQYSVQAHLVLWFSHTLSLEQQRPPVESLESEVLQLDSDA